MNRAICGRDVRVAGQRPAPLAGETPALLQAGRLRHYRRDACPTTCRFMERGARRALALRAARKSVEKRGGWRQAWPMQSVFTGPVYVVRDHIDTDQIIPAEHLNLVPTIAEEYERLGSYALSGLPEALYPRRFVKAGQLDSEYPIVAAGRNFGCGSSREHAPIALGSAGCKVVLAESFARIFFRNSVATGELYPCECVERLCEVLQTGDVVTVDLEGETVTVQKTSQVYKLKPLGEVRPVVEAGGLFNYARKTGMLAKL